MSREQADKGGGLSLQTLLISSVAAVAAAVIVPLIWEKGTLIATALTPIVVAIVSEALRKPAEKITAVAPRVRRFEPRAVEAREPVRVGARTRPERFEPLPRTDDPFGLREPLRPRRPWWRIGLVTGLLAFILGAGVVTASELAVFGGSVSDEGKTTLFGGTDSTREDSRPATDEAAPTATPDAEVTPTVTPEPTATPTPPPAVTPTPAPPAGAEATPAPTP